MSPATKRPNFMSRWVIPITGAVFAIAVLFWLYRDLDMPAFFQALAAAKPAWLFLLAGTILLEQLIRGWKWRQILFDVKPVSSLRLFGAILAGYGVATLIPLGISPLVRSWLIARLEDMRLACVLVTAAIERFLDGIVFALIAGLVAFVGTMPAMEGNVRNGLAVAGALNLLLFGGLMGLLFRGRIPLSRDGSRASRLIDWVAGKAGSRFDGVRDAICEGIVWPRARWRQIGAISASVAMKAVSATHFFWAGLAVGVVLGFWDYLVLMVLAGFAMVMARFVRVPGGFVIGSGLTLNMLGVADEPALAMILFNNIFSIILVVGIGLVVVWRSGIDVRSAWGSTGNRS